MSQALTLARPYARAAYAAARDTGRTMAWSQALALSARIAADPQVQTMLAHPQLGADQAVALLMAGDGDEAYARFLALLAENRRLDLLPEITGLFEQQLSGAVGQDGGDERVVEVGRDVLEGGAQLRGGAQPDARVGQCRGDGRPLGQPSGQGDLAVLPTGLAAQPAAGCRRRRVRTAHGCPGRARLPAARP